MKEGRRLGGVHAGPESKVLSKQSKEERKSELKKRGKREKKEQFLGSRRSELGGGEEHAGRGAKPGRRLRRHEGRLFLIFIFIFSSYSSYSSYSYSS